MPMMMRSYLITASLFVAATLAQATVTSTSSSAALTLTVTTAIPTPAILPVETQMNTAPATTKSMVQISVKAITYTPISWAPVSTKIASTAFATTTVLATAGGGINSGPASSVNGDATGSKTPASLQDPSSNKNSTLTDPSQSYSSSSLFNFADLLMGLVFSLSVMGVVPIMARMYRSRTVTNHNAFSLVFQCLQISVQAMGVYGRYAGFNLALKVAITWICLLLTLWSRMYTVRMTQLLISDFRDWAVYAYIINVVLFLATASPLFAWWWSVKDQLIMWMVVGLPVWVISLILYETGSMAIVGSMLYNKTRRTNWYNASHLQSTRRKFAIMLAILAICISADVMGCVAMGLAYSVPSESQNQETWARVAMYMLPIHFFCTATYFTKATDLGFGVPRNRNSMTAAAAKRNSAILAGTANSSANSLVNATNSGGGPAENPQILRLPKRPPPKFVTLDPRGKGQGGNTLHILH